MGAALPRPGHGLWETPTPFLIVRAFLFFVLTKTNKKGQKHQCELMKLVMCLHGKKWKLPLPDTSRVVSTRSPHPLPAFATSASFYSFASQVGVPEPQFRQHRLSCARGLAHFTLFQPGYCRQPLCRPRDCTLPSLRLGSGPGLSSAAPSCGPDAPAGPERPPHGLPVAPGCWAHSVPCPSCDLLQPLSHFPSGHLSSGGTRGVPWRRLT